MSEVMAITNDMLKGVMSDAILYRGTFSGCIEECTQAGYYNLGGTATTTETTPMKYWNFAILEVIPRNDDILQRLTHIDGEDMFMRVKRMGTWRAWKRINLAPI